MKARNKGLNLGYFTKNKSKMAADAMHAAYSDMVKESIENNENNRDKMYIAKHLCFLNPKTFINRYGEEKDQITTS